MSLSTVEERWNAPPPPWEGPLPGFVLPISTTPLSQPISKNGPAIHAILTSILRGDVGHQSRDAEWSLLFVGPEQSQSGWAVWVADEKDLASVRGIPFQRTMRGRSCTFIAGHRSTVRLRAPVVSETGRHRMRVSTVTPVCIRTNGGAKATPTTLSLWMALQNIARRIKLPLPNPEDIGIVLVDHDTTTLPVSLNQGKNIVTDGWEGTFYVDVNPLGRWLLEVGARLGIGGRNAYGFGRIEVVPARASLGHPFYPTPAELVAKTAIEKTARMWNVTPSSASSALLAGMTTASLCLTKKNGCEVWKITDGFYVLAQRVTLGFHRILDVFKSIDGEDRMPSMGTCNTTANIGP